MKVTAFQGMCVLSVLLGCLIGYIHLPGVEASDWWRFGGLIVFTAILFLMVLSAPPGEGRAKNIIFAACVTCASATVFSIAWLFWV